MTHFFCTRCKEMIPEEAVMRRVRGPGEEPSLLPDEPDVFAIKVALELGIAIEDDSQNLTEVLYHIRHGIGGTTAAGSYGGWHRTTIKCGPLREPTPGERSAHEESERWEAMYGRTALRK